LAGNRIERNFNFYNCFHVSIFFVSFLGILKESKNTQRDLESLPRSFILSQNFQDAPLNSTWVFSTSQSLPKLVSFNNIILKTTKFFSTSNLARLKNFSVMKLLPYNGEKLQKFLFYFCCGKNFNEKLNESKFSRIYFINFFFAVWKICFWKLNGVFL
jgi:hypothetical protein